MRRPDRVDVHRIAPARIADVAVSPALRRPATRVARSEGHQVGGDRIPRIRRRQLGERARARAAFSRAAETRPSSPSGTHACEPWAQRDRRAIWLRGSAAGTRRRSCGSSLARGAGCAAPCAPRRARCRAPHPRKRRERASTSAAYSEAASRTAWPPSASSWLTRPSGESLRSALAITNDDISGRHTGCIMSDVMSMSRPK